MIIRNATGSTMHCITLFPPTENAGGGADVHCGSELLHEHELLGVGVEDHHGHAAVTPVMSRIMMTIMMTIMSLSKII